MAPTLLARVTDNMKVSCEEIFAPVMSIVEFDGIDEAVARANATPFGLSVGLFTSNLHTAFRAARALRFGGVHVNEASSARVDAMPFGGFKYGSLGREGVRFAYEEMTQPKVVCIRRSARRH